MFADAGPFEAGPLDTDRDRRWSPPGRKSCASGSRTSLPPEAVRVGCSGWNYAHWRERFYPKGLPPSRWLEHYATLFDTVEVNNTFYRLPSRESVERWVEQTPDGFSSRSRRAAT